MILAAADYYIDMILYLYQNCDMMMMMNIIYYFVAMLVMLLYWCWRNVSASLSRDL